MKFNKKYYDDHSTLTLFISYCYYKIWVNDMVENPDLRTLAKKVSDKLLGKAQKIQSKESHLNYKIERVNKRVVNSLDEANEEAAKAYANEVGNMKRFNGELHRIGVASEGAGHRFHTVVGLGDSVHAISILGEHSHGLVKGTRILKRSMTNINFDSVNDIMNQNIPSAQMIFNVNSPDAEKVLKEAEYEAKRRQEH
jgi:vacuolar-type H+-ATPase subunit H